MARGDPAINLPAWQSYYAEPGSVFVLTYLTPSQSVCSDDARAYAILRAREGVAMFRGGLFDGVDADVPRAGWLRNGLTWVAYVQVARGATLESLLPTVIRPCNGVSAAYQLLAVTRLRTRGNVFQVADAKVTDFGESPFTSAGELGAKVTGGVVNAVVETALPLAIPLAVVLFVLFRLKR